VEVGKFELWLVQIELVSSIWPPTTFSKELTGVTPW
jgi:hypothetical protein